MRDFCFLFLSATFVRIVGFSQLSAAYVTGPVSLHTNSSLVVLAGLKFHKQLHSPTEETQFRNTESWLGVGESRANILSSPSPVTGCKHRSTLHHGSPSVPLPHTALAHFNFVNNWCECRAHSDGFWTQKMYLALFFKRSSINRMEATRRDQRLLF
jgi:hypothetical protein